MFEIFPYKDSVTPVLEHSKIEEKDRYKKFHEKNFEEESEVFERQDYLDWKYFIYYYKDKPVAFTELKVYDSKHVLTGQFGWDYENPRLGIGTYATLYEIDWAIKNKCKKYYW